MYRMILTLTSSAILSMFGLLVGMVTVADAESRIIEPVPMEIWNVSDIEYEEIEILETPNPIEIEVEEVAEPEPEVVEYTKPEVVEAPEPEYTPEPEPVVETPQPQPEPEPVVEPVVESTPEPAPTIQVYGTNPGNFKSMGVVYSGGHRYTWYSERVLPGGGLTALNNNGRHTDSNGFVCDGDGYIALASNDYSMGTVIDTPFGLGKVYDCGCASGTIDVYVNW